MANVRRKQHGRHPRRAKADEVTAHQEQIPAGGQLALPVAPPKVRWPRWIVAGTILAATFAWAYWPTLARLVRAWEKEADYSHGYLVVPVALLFLWARRDRFPGAAPRLAWAGAVVIALSIGVRMFGARYYIDAIDAWSMLLWVAGVVWFLGGWRVLWWSLPSVIFLWFMIPLPWRVERWASLPLQKIATKLSCFSLQSFGQPALAEGTTIHLGETLIGVEEACSGLRIFMGIIALAFAYVVLVRRPWWYRALVLASALPIALVANATRIVGSGLLYQLVSGEAARTFTHDVSGWVMVPFAAGLFALVIWYLDHLVPEVEIVEVGGLVREKPA